MVGKNHARSSNDTKKTIFAVSGCMLLSSIEPGDRNIAEGRRRSTDSEPSMEEARRLVDEERRRTTTDKLQKFVLDAKYLYRNGAFGLSQNESCIQRITCLTRTKVTEVDLSGIHLCDMLVESLADYLSSPSCIILSLNISKTKLVPRGIKRLAQACTSKLLYFQPSHVKLSTEMIRSKRVLMARSSLDHLDLTAIASFIAGKKKSILEGLDLSGNDLTGSNERCNLYGGMEVLAEALPKCMKLARLLLNHVNLRSDGLVHLALGLHSIPSLRYLEIAGNFIQKNVLNQVCYDGIDAFCESLRGNHTIQSLYLHGNDLDYTSTNKLTHLLCVNDTIQALDISLNPLGSPSMFCIAKALHANTPLIELNLSVCEISCRGCIALADGLVRNTTITSLDLTKNPDIQMLGWTHLIGAMERNVSITRLKLSANDQFDESIQRLYQLSDANASFSLMKKSLDTFDFGQLSSISQMNFVMKLDLLTEDQLTELVSNQSFTQWKLTDMQLSALQYYSSLDMYTPLKRLIWAYDATSRRTDSEERRQRMDKEDTLWDDQPLIELPPIRK